MRIFKICLLLLISSSILLAITPEEFQKIASQYKMVDNSKEEIPKLYFKTKDGNVTMYFNKTQDEDGYFVSPIVKFNNITIYQQDKYGAGIFNNDISNFATLCYSKNNDMYLVSQISSLAILKKGGRIGGINGILTLDKKQKIVFYKNYMFKINYKNPIWDNYESGFDSSKIFDSPIQRTYIPYNPKEFFPFYNEEKILERLYETGTCHKEATKNANIEVLVDDKWIPQEESWDIQKNKKSKLFTINLKKQHLYKTPPIKTKMYLIKGDKVEVLEEKNDWLYILYKGKKDIKDWIPKSAVE